MATAQSLPRIQWTEEPGELRVRLVVSGTGLKQLGTSNSYVLPDRQFNYFYIIKFYIYSMEFLKG